MAQIKVALPMGVAFLLSAIVMLHPQGSVASTWRLIAVAQPLLQEGDFLTIGDVHYGVDDFIPGREVALTCEPNSTRMIGEEFEAEVEDLNAARRFGLSLEMTPVRDDGTRVDTLTVTLNATKMRDVRDGGRLQCPPDTIVEATVLCIRINAARSVRTAKFVKVRILGSPSLQRLAGVHPVIGREAELGLRARPFDTCAPGEQKPPPRTR